jgi:enterochelin esterase-like enzyme
VEGEKARGTAAMLPGCGRLHRERVVPGHDATLRDELRRARVFRRWGAVAIVVIVLVLAALIVADGFGVDSHGARVVRFNIASRFVHQTLPVAAVVPAGSTEGRRPLLVFLHGKGGDENSELDDAMFAALAGLGPRAPDVVFPYGGPDSYWHNRAGGGWGAYVMREVIPEAIRRLHADPRRVAIGGISMGGFGAFNLARLAPDRFCAVGGHSAALWASGGETAAGAFDDAEDFSRNDVIGSARVRDPYRGLAVWIDVGSEDPFRAADTRLADDLQREGQRVRFHVWPGGHDGSYWSAHWNSYLRFYAGALGRC